jgi:OOP family OmpA-OmpF porin
MMLAVFTGCAAMRDNPSMCKAVTTGTGALLGATAGGLISGVAADHGDESEGSTNWEIGLSTGGGALGGGLIGFLLGHALCPEPAPRPVTTAPPPAPPPPAPSTKIASIRGANFEFDKSRLTAEGRSAVAGAAATLKQHPSVNVSVDGYTDSVGSDSYNKALGERRARTVASALAEEGISPSRMTVRSFGESNPVASNDTAEGRAENRRVEIVVR